MNNFSLGIRRMFPAITRRKFWNDLPSETAAGKSPQFLSKLTRQICSGDYSVDKNCQVLDNNTEIPFDLIFLSCLQHKTITETKCRNILRLSVSTCNKREAVNKWSYCIAFQIHLFCCSWEQGSGVKTAYIMLTQTSETKILMCCVSCWKTDQHFSQLTGTWFLQNYKMFLKYPLFLAVLGTGCQKRRLHTDLTLTEHSFSQSWWAKGWNLDAFAKEGCSWYASRNTGEYSETAALWLVWEK